MPANLTIVWERAALELGVTAAQVGEVKRRQATLDSGDATLVPADKVFADLGLR